MGVIFKKNLDLSPNWGHKHWAISGRWVAAELQKLADLKNKMATE